MGDTLIIVFYLNYFIYKCIETLIQYNNKPWSVHFIQPPIYKFNFNYILKKMIHVGRYLHLVFKNIIIFRMVFIFIKISTFCGFILINMNIERSHSEIGTAMININIHVCLQHERACLACRGSWLSRCSLRCCMGIIKLFTGSCSQQQLRDNIIPLHC